MSSSTRAVSSRVPAPFGGVETRAFNPGLDPRDELSASSMSNPSITSQSSGRRAGDHQPTPPPSLPPTGHTHQLEHVVPTAPPAVSSSSSRRLNQSLDRGGTSDDTIESRNNVVNHNSRRRKRTEAGLRRVIQSSADVARMGGDGASPPLLDQDLLSHQNYVVGAAQVNPRGWERNSSTGCTTSSTRGDYVNELETRDRVDVVVNELR